MKIDINKDFETAFQATVWRGMTKREMVTAVAALSAAAAVIVLVWHTTGIPIDVCVYFGIPVMVPIVIIGLFRYQGSGLREILSEMMYLYHTRDLPYEAGEYFEDRLPVFTMKSRSSAPGKGAKKGGKKNGGF